MLLKILEQDKTGVQYPVIDCLVTDARGRAWNNWSYLQNACFDDLFSADEGELAGMGLAIIGNLCKALDAKLISPQADAELHLRFAKDAVHILCPWPGMPDARPVPLDLTQMPFDPLMFLDAEQFRWRVNRMELMHRIESVWVPWLKGTLWSKL